VRRGWLRGSDERWLIISTLFAGCGLALMGWLPGIALPIFAGCLHNMGRGSFRPLLGAYTQHHIESGYRATYGSLQSFVGRCANGVVLLMVTWFLTGRSGEQGIKLTWTICGLSLVALTWFFHTRRPKT